MNNRIYLPEPHVNQRPILDSTARFKLVRAGRRFGKDRLSLNAAVIGHGQGRWKGIAQGTDVAWIGPDYPQIRAIWREEVRPRFAGVEGVELNESERRVTFRGLGSLQFRSAENIDSIRGSKLGGVVLNEAAYFDLEYALREVIMPALIDLGGWAIIDSTPNAGPDGHVDEAGKRSPSYFNILCDRAGMGELGADGTWQHWHFTSYDNPKIPREEIDRLVAEYPQDSPALQQEIFAKLIAAGAGVAFPEWEQAIHVTTQTPERLSGEWRWSAGMDWGFRAPGWFGLFATTGEYSVCRWEYYFREQTPYKVGFTIGERIKSFPKPEWIALDSACWNVTDGGPTIAEQITDGLDAACGSQAPPVISTAKGAGSPVTGKLMVHEALRFTRDADGSVKQWNRPKLVVHEECRNLIRTLPKLPLDEKDPERVDTNAEDHCLAPGTLVLTSGGWLPIAELPDARVTARNAEVVQLTHTWGSLVCTPNHRILTPDGWTEAQYLSDGQEILWSSPIHARSTLASGTIAAVSTSCGRGSWTVASGTESGASIERYGRMPTGQCLTDGTFTTSITIAPTTDSKTSHASGVGGTRLCIPLSQQQDSERPEAETPAALVERVIAACLARSEPTRVRAVTAHGKLPTVYDVGVAHALHGYVAAGGLVVHNCFDGLRYWLMARTPTVDTSRPEPFSRDVSYGFDKEGRKVKPWDRSEELVHEGPRYRRAQTTQATGGYEW